MSTYLGRVIPLDYCYDGSVLVDDGSVLVDDGANDIWISKDRVIITECTDGAKHAYIPPLQ